MKKAILIFFLGVGFGAFAQHDHHATESAQKETGAPSFKDAKLSAAYTHYIQLKDALVASNAENAKTSARQLAKSLGSLTNATKAAEAATKISGITDLSQQRLLFSDLSREMSTLVKGGKLSSGNVYIEFCPMANGSKGAFWLSNEKEIRNPYFGDKMLKCGSVKETVQ